MTRQEANKEIIKLLSSFIEENPDLRWAQLMPPNHNFYEESTETLKNVGDFLSGMACVAPQTKRSIRSDRF